jgi:hypothetical protein
MPYALFLTLRLIASASSSFAALALAQAFLVSAGQNCQHFSIG